jgi:hypothetical protein
MSYSPSSLLTGTKSSHAMLSEFPLQKSKRTLDSIEEFEWGRVFVDGNEEEKLSQQPHP